MPRSSDAGRAALSALRRDRAEVSARQAVGSGTGRIVTYRKSVQHDGCLLVGILKPGRARQPGRTHGFDEKKPYRVVRGRPAGHRQPKQRSRPDAARMLINKRMPHASTDAEDGGADAFGKLKRSSAGGFPPGGAGWVSVPLLEMPRISDAGRAALRSFATTGRR